LRIDDWVSAGFEIIWKWEIVHRSWGLGREGGCGGDQIYEESGE
jgi:hypothetical protein